MQEGFIDGLFDAIPTGILMGSLGSAFLWLPTLLGSAGLGPGTRLLGYGLGVLVTILFLPFTRLLMEDNTAGMNDHYKAGYGFGMAGVILGTAVFVVMLLLKD